MIQTIRRLIGCKCWVASNLDDFKPATSPAGQANDIGGGTFQPSSYGTGTGV